MPFVRDALEAAGLELLLTIDPCIRPSSETRTGLNREVKDEQCRDLDVAPNEIRLWVQATLDYPDTVVLFLAGWNDRAPALRQ